MILFDQRNPLNIQVDSSEHRLTLDGRMVPVAYGGMGHSAFPNNFRHSGLQTDSGADGGVGLEAQRYH